MELRKRRFKIIAEEELKQELQLEEPTVFIERNGVYYRVPRFVEKELDDLEWLKTKLNLTFVESLSDVEDKVRLLKVMGINMEEWL